MHSIHWREGKRVRFTHLGLNNSICPFCNINIPDDAEYCPQCGRRITYVRRNSPVYPSLFEGSIDSFVASGASTASCFADFPDSQLIRDGKDEFDSYWMKLPDELSNALNRGLIAQKKLDTELKIRKTASEITNLMGVTNALFQSKRQARLFREDQPNVIRQLFTTCEDSDSLAARIAGLCSLFEVERGPLRRLVSSPGDLGTIELVRKWLDEEVIQYSPDMIECWRKIVKLRNLTPLHAHRPEDIMEILDFFDLTTNRDSEKVWDSVINKFLESLEEWHSILCKIRSEPA